MIELTDKDYEELHDYLGIDAEEAEIMTDEELEDAFVSINEIKLSWKESDDER